MSTPAEQPIKLSAPTWEDYELHPFESIAEEPQEAQQTQPQTHDDEPGAATGT